MGKETTNIEQQIENLKQRGMILDLEKSKIEEILLDIGYYRLGFYWHPFELNGNHEFKKGTKFSDAIALYYLDVDLRNILLKCLNRIEINFKTKVIYYVSNKFNSGTWFVDKRIMQSDFVDNFHKYYSKTFIHDNKTIKRHHEKYINDKYAPAWKTLEFLTFGTILKIFKSIKETEIKTEIAKTYGIKDRKALENYIRTILFIRNECAHGGVLFDLNTKTEIKITPLILFNNHLNNKHSLDSCIKVILYFLGQISENRKDETEIAINKLFSKNASNKIIRKIIVEQIGYNLI